MRLADTGIRMKYAQKQSDSEGQPAVAISARGSNQSGLRAHNERLVLSLIRQSGALAKAEIARMTGLSAQTVSVIMRALEADGLLKKDAPVRGKVGQPSVPMSLNRDGALFLGLKVGRRSLDLVLTDFLGRIVDRKSLTHRYPTPDHVVSFTNDAITQMLEKLPPERRARVAGLGIAIPFRLWDWAGILGVTPEEMAGWRDRDIALEIAESWNFPVYLRNDGSAACGAELVFGDQDKPRDFLYFFVGFFIGGGLVLDNALFTGRTGNAAALGSIPLGKDGQLVDVASLASLEVAINQAGGDGGAIWEDPESWTAPPDILDAWLEKATNGMAMAIISSACLIDFECVLIDGWMPAPIRADLVARTARRVRELSLAGIDAPEIREGAIGSDARSLGAASLPLSERFLVDRNAFLKG